MEPNVIPKKFRKTQGHTQRRKGSLKRLENQLLTGFKTINLPDGSIGTIPLSEADKTRIRRETETLRNRI